MPSVSDIAAALILADKTDVRHTRVRNKRQATFDIEIDNEEAEKIVTVGDAVEPVSYTHLDVYKRQMFG